MKKQIIIPILIFIGATGFYSCSEEDTSSALSADSELFGFQRAGSDYGRMAMFAEILNLTDAQKEQIQEIIANQHKRIKEKYLNEDGEKSHLKNRSGAHKGFHDAFINAIMPVLTAEQKSIVEDMKAQVDQGKIPSQIVEKRLEMLTTELILTIEQQSQIRTLLSEHVYKMLSYRNKEVDRKVHRQNMMNLKTEVDKQLRIILNDDQFTRYEELRKQNRQHAKDKFRKYGQKFDERRIERRMVHLTSELELNSEQQEQIRNILEKVHQDIQSEMETAEGMGPHHEIMKEKFEAVDDQIKGILNEAQMEKYETLKAERESHWAKRKWNKL